MQKVNMPSEIKLYNQDCMEAMKNMPDKSFDLAIVDPPYGIGRTWSKSRNDRFYRHKSTYTNTKDQMPSKEYFKHLKRVSNHQVVWGWNYFTELLAPSNNIIVWDKLRSFLDTNMSECEFAWTSFSSAARIARFEWNGFLKGREKGLQKIHPFQKPVDLYSWILKNYSSCGATILDTHLGSGSIAIACYDMGFSLTGYEIDKDYYDAAVKRLDNHKKQLTLY